MDSSLKVAALAVEQLRPKSIGQGNVQDVRDETVVPLKEYGDVNDLVQVEVHGKFKALKVSADKILERLNEKLGLNFVSSLSKEEGFYTPEKTADRIVTGISLLFDRFAQQNPKLGKEELVTEFFKRARSGMNEGYSSAVGTLKEVGAWEHEGMKESIEETRRLLDDKMNAFERMKRLEMGLPVANPDEITIDAKLIVQKEVQDSAKVRIVA